MKSRMQRWSVAVLMVFALSVCLNLGAPSTASAKKTLVLADLGWDSAQFHNRVVGFILENGYGYTPDYMPGETIPLLQGLARGDLDINMEIWIENQQKPYEKAIAEGKVIDLGANFPDSWQGWLVPTYMVKGDAKRGIKATAPGLKSVSDLPKYWELFKDPENPKKGRFYQCIAGWGCEAINAEKIKTYGLDKYYDEFHPGSGAALAASMVGAYKKGKPWLGYYWGPTWVLGKLDMTPLEEPAFDRKVWDKDKGCSFPSVRVNIAVNSDMPKKAPGVVEFLKKYETSQAMVNKALAFMQDNKASTQQAAEWFLKEYQDLWSGWVPADIAVKVKAALK